MKTTRAWSVLGVAVAATVVLTACGSSSPSSSSSGGGSHPITVLIASSGDAETAAVKQAVAAWSASSGTKASVQVASDEDQQLTQGFAGGNPADVFYLSTSQMSAYGANGSLYAYGNQLNASSFYPSLVQAFSVNGKLQCAPKDFSTLALVINTKLWKAAGLTDKEIPTTWAQLETDAKKLTRNGVVGLTMSPQIERMGAFAAEAGGAMQNAAGTKATVDSKQNLQALTYLKGLETAGVMKDSTALGTGWGGEAFGTKKAAMTVEGNWIAGSMSSDYPTVPWRAVELPQGPAGKGTLAFTNCWGIAQASPSKAADVSLVKFLTQPSQQIKFANAFGVIPSVKAAATSWAASSKGKAFAPFIAGAAYAQNLPEQPGASDVIADYDSQLAQLANTDPKQILQRIQSELQATIK